MTLTSPYSYAILLCIAARETPPSNPDRRRELLSLAQYIPAYDRPPVSEYLSLPNLFICECGKWRWSTHFNYHRTCPACFKSVDLHYPLIDFAYHFQHLPYNHQDYILAVSRYYVALRSARRRTNHGN